MCTFRSEFPVGQFPLKHITKILVVVVALLVSVAPPAQGQGWTVTGNMSVERVGHIAVLLADGRVLVIGGHTSAGTVMSTAELYDPATGSWTVTSSMSVGRSGHTATALTDGRVLVVGGDTPTAIVNTAELYDPATGTWTMPGSMNVARSGHTATALTDGRVLVAGGSHPIYMTP